MLTKATSPTAPVPVLGRSASQPISRCTGAEVATTYPPIATKAICMVKVIRLQKPLPKATLTATGEAPFAMAATATTTTAIATKTKASGNQRSAHAVNPIAIRANAPSRFVEGSEDAVEIVVIMMKSPKHSAQIAGHHGPPDMGRHILRFSDPIRVRMNCCGRK
jgi:hypothetical protein